MSDITPTTTPEYAVKAPAMPSVLFVEVKDGQGNIIATTTVTSKDFKTGSKGFYAQFKAAIGWKRYQGQFQLVEIGSKPNGKASA